MSRFRPSCFPPRLLWPVALMLVVSWFSGKGEINVPFTFGLPDFDKFAHFGVFGLLMISVARAGGRRARGFGWCLAGLLTAVLFGLLDETLQSLNPRRSGLDVADWLADVAGALTAMFLWRGWNWGHGLLEYELRLSLGRRRLKAKVEDSEVTIPAASP